MPCTWCMCHDRGVLFPPAQGDHILWYHRLTKLFHSNLGSAPPPPPEPRRNTGYLDMRFEAL